MAPEMKADAATVAKMLDIKRTVWMESTGIEITPVAHKPSNGRPNKNPKKNASIELTAFSGPDGEETTTTYIADPWPVDYGSVEANEQERRVSGGQGPRVKVAQLAFDEKGQSQGLIFGLRLSPTKKHWKRSERRLANRLARAARHVNERRLRKPVTSRLRGAPSLGPTPKGRSIRAQKEEKS